MTGWMEMGEWEYEFDANGFTDWYRCVGGRMANGLWPCWHTITGKQKYC